MNNLKQTLKIRMPLWQILWRITGVLLIVLGIIGLVEIDVWYGQTVHTLPEEIPRAWPIFFIFPGCLIAIAAGVITVIGRFWRDYPRVIILYTLALIAGFTAIGLGYAVSNDSGLETAISVLGICIVILIGLTILLRDHSVTKCAKHSKTVLFAFIMSLLVFVLYGYVLPQWFDAAARCFPDPKLRAAIREEVGKPFGWIHQGDLENITSLYSYEWAITDITGIEKCINIKDLRLNCNIEGITPLSALISLEHLDLFSNKISDISPLLENDGLGVGDSVDLEWNPLSNDSLEIYIPQLQQRGVDVEW